MGFALSSTLETGVRAFGRDSALRNPQPKLRAPQGGGRASHRAGAVAHGPRLGGGGHIEARGDRRPGDGVFACDERGRVGSPAFPRQ